MRNEFDDGVLLVRLGEFTKQMVPYHPVKTGEKVSDAK